MKRVLIVCPHFPPVNAPDMHRVRMSIQFFPQFGWEPIILAVDSKFSNFPTEPDLMQTLGAEVEVHRAAALPVAMTRMLGVGDLGLRSFWYAYRLGSQLLCQRKIDLTCYDSRFPVCTILPIACRLGIEKQ